MCAVATSVQNLHLAVTSVPGLGGYWSSTNWCRAWRESADMRQYCGLGDAEDKVLGCFVLGRVDPAKVFRGQRRDVAEKVTWK